MYQEFFGLREPPFRDTPDPRFTVPIPSHEAAYAAISAGITQGKGLLVLTGPPGTGKTILLNRLAAALPRSAQVVAVPYPNVTLDDVLWYLAKALDLAAGGDGADAVIDQLHGEIARRRDRGEQVLLIVDEAQALPRATLASLPALLEGAASPDGSRALQILLAGQPALDTAVGELGLSTSAVRTRLEPLSATESALYVRARLQHAGGAADDVFAPPAIARLARLSAGTPRLLSVLCDRCLAAAFVAGAHQVTPAIVKQVWASDRTLATTEAPRERVLPDRAPTAAPPRPAAPPPAKPTVAPRPAPASTSPQVPPPPRVVPTPVARARRGDLPFPAPTRTTAARAGRSRRAVGAGAMVLLGALAMAVAWRARVPGPSEVAMEVATPATPPATLAPAPVLAPEVRRVVADRETFPDGSRPSASEALDVVDEFRRALESRDGDRLRRVFAPDVAEGDQRGLAAVAAHYDRVLRTVENVAYVQPTATVVPHRDRMIVTAPFVIRFQNPKGAPREATGTAAWDVERRDDRVVIVAIEGELSRAMAP